MNQAPLKILLFHPCELPPRNYGGIERMVLWLAKGLVEEGHEVWVAAFPQSRLPDGVRLFPVSPERSSPREVMNEFPPGLDLVHFMAPPEESVWSEFAENECAAILTVHGNGQPEEVFPLNSVFISRNHALRHGGSVFVYNGIDPSEYHFTPERKKDYYLFLSKTSWSVKNVKGAIRLCSEAGVPLKVSGGSRPFFQRIRVALKPQMNWVGPVAGTAKATLLAEAKALLFPVIWDEPFGLVVAEALMSGTPVIASERGSLSELIPPEVGALIPPRPPESSSGEWMRFLTNEPLSFDPEACREWALRKFHYKKMAQEYVRIYRQAIGGGKLHSEMPRTLPAKAQSAVLAQ